MKKYFLTLLLFGCNLSISCMEQDLSISCIEQNPSIFCREQDPSRTYYTLLDIAENATHSQIKEAYKKLALEFHPDKCDLVKHKMSLDQAEEHFKTIQNAYEILKNKQTRKYYDQSLRIPTSKGFEQPLRQPNSDVHFHFSEQDILKDITSQSNVFKFNISVVNKIFALKQMAINHLNSLCNRFRLMSNEKSIDFIKEKIFECALLISQKCFRIREFKTGKEFCDLVKEWNLLTGGNDSLIQLNESLEKIGMKNDFFLVKQEQHRKTNKVYTKKDAKRWTKKRKYIQKHGQKNYEDFFPKKRKTEKSPSQNQDKFITFCYAFNKIVNISNKENNSNSLKEMFIKELPLIMEEYFNNNQLNIERIAAFQKEALSKYYDAAQYCKERQEFDMAYEIIDLALSVKWPRVQDLSLIEIELLNKELIDSGFLSIETIEKALNYKQEPKVAAPVQSDFAKIGALFNELNKESSSDAVSFLGLYITNLSKAIMEKKNDEIIQILLNDQRLYDTIKFTLNSDSNDEAFEQQALKLFHDGIMFFLREPIRFDIIKKAYALPWKYNTRELRMLNNFYNNIK